MKNRKLLSFSLALGMLFQVACSVGLKGGSEDMGFAPPEQKPDRSHQVQGPFLDGVWKSACHANFKDYEIVSMTVQGQDVIRKTEVFSDSGCSQSTKVKGWKGGFRYMSQLEDSVFEVQYLIDLGNGATQITGENIKLSDETLWISEYYLGATAKPTLALIRQKDSASQNPDGKPDSGTTPGAEEFSPRVGQMIRYEGTRGGQVYSETSTVLEQNTSAGSWTISTSMIRGGQTSEVTSEISQLWSAAQNRQLLSNCESRGGRLENVRVRAGIFPSCLMVVNGFNVWYGAAPIWGQLKIESQDGSLKVEAVSMKF